MGLLIIIITNLCVHIICSAFEIVYAYLFIRIHELSFNWFSSVLMFILSFYIKCLLKHYLRNGKTKYIYNKN